MSWPSMRRAQGGGWCGWCGWCGGVGDAHA
jgi:hypothetical protein